MKHLPIGPLYYEFSRHHEPRLRIQPGETVVVATEDALSGQIRNDADRRDKTRIPHSNPLTGPLATGPAGPHGGNMDIVETCPGNTVYLPVFVPGGQLYLGDAHAAMGHGELSATGLEMPAESTITVDLIKGKRLSWPRIESPR